MLGQGRELVFAERISSGWGPSLGAGTPLLLHKIPPDWSKTHPSDYQSTLLRQIDVGVALLQALIYCFSAAIGVIISLWFYYLRKCLFSEYSIANVPVLTLMNGFQWNPK